MEWLKTFKRRHDSFRPWSWQMQMSQPRHFTRRIAVATRPSVLTARLFQSANLRRKLRARERNSNFYNWFYWQNIFELRVFETHGTQTWSLCRQRTHVTCFFVVIFIHKNKWPPARKTTWPPSLVLTCGLKVTQPGKIQGHSRCIKTALIQVTTRLIQQFNRFNWRVASALLKARQFLRERK